MACGRLCHDIAGGSGWYGVNHRPLERSGLATRYMDSSGLSCIDAGVNTEWPIAGRAVLVETVRFLSFPATLITVGSLIQATALWGYREVVHQLGADPSAYLARFGIPRGVDEREDEFISFTAFVAMLEATAEELKCPDLGLRLSHWQGLDVLGPVAVIARNARTLLSAVDDVAHYLFVHSPAMTLHRAPWPPDPDIAFSFQVTDPNVTSAIQSYELSMGVAVQIVHLLGGPDVVPAYIAFPHPQQGPDEAYRDVLGCPVKFNRAWCGFALSPESAELPIVGADTATRRMARRYLDSRYIPPTAKLSERVADLARSLLPTGRCSLDAIATAMATPPRTLQRRLAAEGTSCQDVIERERRNLAARYLANRDIELSHVAGLVGYAEQSALNRSCKRWFDMTPRQYRAALTA